MRDTPEYKLQWGEVTRAGLPYLLILPSPGILKVECRCQNWTRGFRRPSQSILLEDMSPLGIQSNLAQVCLEWINVERMAQIVGREVLRGGRNETKEWPLTLCKKRFVHLRSVYVWQCMSVHVCSSILLVDFETWSIHWADNKNKPGAHLDVSVCQYLVIYCLMSYSCWNLLLFTHMCLHYNMIKVYSHCQPNVYFIFQNQPKIHYYRRVLTCTNIHRPQVEQAFFTEIDS